MINKVLNIGFIAVCQPYTVVILQ